MIYEIINPSDPYTLVADDLEVATVAVCMLREGRYALRPEEENAPGVPLFFFGGQDDWCYARFGMHFESLCDEIIKQKRDALATCLESVVIGDRRQYEQAIVGKSDDLIACFRTAWHEEHRSSMNNIGARAWAIAARLRATEETPTHDAH